MPVSHAGDPGSKPALSGLSGTGYTHALRKTLVQSDANPLPLIPPTADYQVLWQNRFIIKPVGFLIKMRQALRYFPPKIPAFFKILVMGFNYLSF